jgi:hypothetical protein
LRHRGDFMLWLLQSDKGKQIDFGAGRRAIAVLRETPLAEWPEEFVDRYIGDLDDLTPSGLEALQDRQVRELQRDLAIIEEAVIESSRQDAWSGEIGNKFVILSGGPRYLPQPTETALSIDRLDAAGIAQAMGFDSR